MQRKIISSSHALGSLEIIDSFIFTFIHFQLFWLPSNSQYFVTLIGSEQGVSSHIGFLFIYCSRCSEDLFFPSN